MLYQGYFFFYSIKAGISLVQKKFSSIISLNRFVPHCSFLQECPLCTSFVFHKYCLLFYFIVFIIFSFLSFLIPIIPILALLSTEYIHSTSCWCEFIPSMRVSLLFSKISPHVGSCVLICDFTLEMFYSGLLFPQGCHEMGCGCEQTLFKSFISESVTIYALPWGCL